MTATAGKTATTLPYRPGVGIVLINRYGLVWIGRRVPKWFEDQTQHVWQLPQGGLEADETLEAATMRELAEETGVTSARILAQSAGWLTYELPEELVGIALKGKYRGQRHKWFAVAFEGDDSEISIRPQKGRKAEFDAWRWSRLDEAAELAVPFKRDIYRDVARQFRHLVA